MKFQRTSLILVATALVLGGVVYYMESKNQPQQEAKTESKALFNFKEADVQTFSVKTPKQTVAFEKKAAAAGQSLWQMSAPEKTQADDGAVAFLLNLMATGRSDRTLTIPAARKAEFGLDQPAAMVDVKLANQQTHQLVLGKPIFNRSFVYALVDPSGNPNQDLSILLVPIDFQNAVDRPLAEWKKEKPKPKDTKASPSPTAGPTARPTVSPSPSPNGAVSPSPSPAATVSPTASPSPKASSPSPSPSPSQ